jgi:hypothetical protein
MQDVHAVGKPGESVELARRNAKFRRQIHSGDAASEFCGKPSGRPSDAATDIEQMITRLRLQYRGKFLVAITPFPWKWSIGARVSGVIGTSGPFTFRTAVRTRAVMPSLA